MDRWKNKMKFYFVGQQMPSDLSASEQVLSIDKMKSNSIFIWVFYFRFEFHAYRDLVVKHFS